MTTRHQRVAAKIAQLMRRGLLQSGAVSAVGEGEFTTLLRSARRQRIDKAQEFLKELEALWNEHDENPDSAKRFVRRCIEICRIVTANRFSLVNECDLAIAQHA